MPNVSECALADTGAGQDQEEDRIRNESSAIAFRTAGSRVEVIRLEDQGRIELS